MNRTLEGNAAVNEDVDQANAITALSDELSKTKDIQGKIIVPASLQRPNILFVNPVTEVIKSSQAGKRPIGGFRNQPAETSNTSSYRKAVLRHNGYHAKLCCCFGCFIRK